MEASQILQSSLLDIVFENRNHHYGAYELRKNYPQRAMKALGISIAVVGAVISLVAFTPKKRLDDTEKARPVTMIAEITEPPKPVVETPPPVQQQPPPARTERYVVPVIAPDEQFTEPIASIEDLDNARISDITQDGPVDDNISVPAAISDGDGKGIIQEKQKSDEPATVVQVQAAYNGNWSRFLEKNLRGDVPVENGAPAGNHKVMIRFVVDLDGSISQVIPLTSAGYGMEEEAMRVIRKAGDWTPAIQDGKAVKAYRIQTITFQISGE